MKYSGDDRFMSKALPPPSKEEIPLDPLSRLLDFSNFATEYNNFATFNSTIVFFSFCYGEEGEQTAASNFPKEEIALDQLRRLRDPSVLAASPKYEILS